MQLKSVDLLEDTTALIQACIEGNRYFQSRLYEIYSPKMFSICLRYAKNREEAEEILQEGFVQAFKSLKKFKNTGSFEGWIKKIMLYCAIQQYRSKSKLYPVVDIDTVYLGETGTEDIITQLGKKELLKMVQALPPAYRMIFNLYVFEGMKHKEIAALLGIAEGTSKSNLSDAKAILQRAVTNSLKVAKQKF
jgi:RNA polymerase sigma factor (sigma-70 family)